LLNVSDPDVFSGQDQIDERNQGGPDTGRNEKIVGVDIVHGIEQWIVFSAIDPFYGGWNGNAVRQFTIRRVSLR
jgi:hypothetical protein